MDQLIIDQVLHINNSDLCIDDILLFNRLCSILYSFAVYDRIS